MFYTQLYGFKQLFLFNNNQLFAPLYGFKYNYLIQIIFKTTLWLIDKAVIGQNRSGSNGIEGTLHTHQISRIGVSQLDAV